MTFIRHITLTTGHTRDSMPGEVSPEALAAVTTLLEDCLSHPDETQPIPGPPGYSLSVRAASKCLVAVVWADGPPSEALVTIGVATHSRCGANLWRELHRCGEAPVATDPQRCPPEPWVAAALERGITRYPDAASWLGDLERVIGWSFLEMVNRDAAS